MTIHGNSFLEVGIHGVKGVSSLEGTGEEDGEGGGVETREREGEGEEEGREEKDTGVRIRTEDPVQRFRETVVLNGKNHRARE